jgi:hypothetical protein
MAQQHDRLGEQGYLMWNPFRPSPDQAAGRSGPIELLRRRRGAYTIEMPTVGTGHYVFDPSDSCSIHSRRLEAWCDVFDFDTAREELHWHCMTLSQLEGDSEDIRKMGGQLIEGRQEKRIAQREIALEAEMATVEGTIKSMPGRVRTEREEVEQANEREQALRREAESRDRKLDELRQRFNSLPRRARVEIKFRLVLAVSISFTVFDVGVMGSAFELIPGATAWKVILTLGVALAPISVAIGIAQWFSAAELPIREGVKATRLAIVAGTLCIIGIGLIVLFRAAATGDPPLPAKAYAFLAFIQSALAIAEAMIYTVYFDSKVGTALRERIVDAETAIDKIGEEAVAEHGRARAAHSRIGSIEMDAEQAGSKLQRETKQLGDIRKEEEGLATVLEAIVEHAIQEGVQAARRARERRDEEAEAKVADGNASPDMRKWVAGATAAIVLALIATGSPF